MRKVDIIRLWAETVITVLNEAVPEEDGFDVDFVLHQFRTAFPHLVECLGGHLTQRRADIIGIVNTTVKYSPVTSSVYTREIFGVEWRDFVRSYEA